MLMTMIFMCLLFWVFADLLAFAVRATWGITRLIFTFVFFPLVLVGMVFAGMIYIAFPILIVMGIASLFRKA